MYRLKDTIVTSTDGAPVRLCTVSMAPQLDMHKSFQGTTHSIIPPQLILQ